MDAGEDEAMRTIALVSVVVLKIAATFLGGCGDDSGGTGGAGGGTTATTTSGSTTASSGTTVASSTSAASTTTSQTGTGGGSSSTGEGGGTGGGSSGTGGAGGAGAGGEGGGGDFTAICEDFCEDAVSCDQKGDCVGGCVSLLDENPGCADELTAYGDCIAVDGCGPNDCVTEGNAYIACLQGEGLVCDEESNGQGDACESTYVCSDDHEYLVSCVGKPGAPYDCDCTVDDELVGSCQQEDPKTSACDLETGCCARLFGI
jgi:hypothetical protein